MGGGVSLIIWDGIVNLIVLGSAIAFGRFSSCSHRSHPSM